MGSSLSNLVNILSEGIHQINYKYGYDHKTFRTKYKYCKCSFEYRNFKHDLIEYKCLYYNKNHQQNLMKS